MINVLIAVDDSEESVTAARVAHELFGDSATYTIVSVAAQTLAWGGEPMIWGMGYAVVIPPLGVLGPATSVHDTTLDDAREVAHDIAAAADLQGAQLVGETGDPARAIIDAARHHQADVIVVGSHDRGWFSRLFSPPVTGAVINDCDIPVLIAR